MQNIDLNLIIIAVISLIIGGVIAWFLLMQKYGKDSVSKKEFDSIQNKLNDSASNLKVENEKVRNLENDVSDIKQEKDQKSKEVIRFTSEMATKNQQLKTAISNEKTVNDKLEILEENLDTNKDLISQLRTEKAQIEVEKKGANKEINSLKEKLITSEKSLLNKTDDYNAVNRQLATANANNKALEDNLRTQKKEIEDMGIKFNTEFENIAAKILKANTKSFSELNETMMMMK